MDEEQFPLHEWFDTSKPIAREQREEAEEQIQFYAFKDGYGRREARKTIGQMRAAIRAHNQRFSSTH